MGIPKASALVEMIMVLEEKEGYFYCRTVVGVTMPSWGKRNRQWGRGVCEVRGCVGD
jgi:hypothetical protein